MRGILGIVNIHVANYYSYDNHVICARYSGIFGYLKKEDFNILKVDVLKNQLG